MKRKKSKKAIRVKIQRRFRLIDASYFIPIAVFVGILFIAFLIVFQKPAAINYTDLSEPTPTPTLIPISTTSPVPTAF